MMLDMDTFGVVFCDAPANRCFVCPWYTGNPDDFVHC